MYRVGNYQLIAKLGVGGMAEVWKARQLDRPDGPLVVVKRVLPEHAHDPSFVRSLRNEARVLTRLDHPRIVRLLALEEIDGQIVLALEHVDGCDLHRVLAGAPKDQPMAPGLGAYVVHEICTALAHAHRFEDGILHRDISPSNVMITWGGEVKLVDFGIAKALFDNGDEATRSRSIKGKLAYMAPEQIRGEKLGCAADIYGAGVLLYELLTGRRLFTGKTLAAMAMAREARVSPPSGTNPLVPPALDEICLRALAYRPDARFADGQAMADALAPLLPQLGFGRAQLVEMASRAVPAAERATAPGTVTVPAKATPGRRAWWPIPLLALLVLGVAGWWLHRIWNVPVIDPPPLVKMDIPPPPPLPEKEFVPPPPPPPPPKRAAARPVKKPKPSRKPAVVEGDLAPF